MWSQETRWHGMQPMHRYLRGLFPWTTRFDAVEMYGTKHRKACEEKPVSVKMRTLMSDWKDLRTTREEEDRDVKAGQ